MDKKSLTEARLSILKSLQNCDIDSVDKLELMINLNQLLDEDHYDKDIKTLKLSNKKDKK
jgi:hypothetical protein